LGWSTTATHQVVSPASRRMLWPRWVLYPTFPTVTARLPALFRSLAALAALATLASSSACQPKPHAKAKVVTTIFPIYDLTRRIAGPDADVIQLEPGERSPHQYTAAGAGDADRVAGASLAVMVGLDLDAWLQPVMTQVAPKARVLRLADRVPTLPRTPGLGDGPQPKRGGKAPPGAESTPSPDTIDVHVWLDPQRALLMARAISDELCRADPSHAAGFRTRSLELTKSLEALDKELEARTAAWKQKTFVTLHDSFRYYAARYHLEVAAAVESRPGVRPPTRYEQVVLERLREKGAGGVFGEPQLDSLPAKVVAHAAQLPYGVLDPLGGTPGVDSYEALLRADTDVLEKALGPAASPAPSQSAPVPDGSAAPLPRPPSRPGAPSESAP
jgi:zinc transport system substrate-binding protein